MKKKVTIIGTGLGGLASGLLLIKKVLENRWCGMSS